MLSASGALSVILDVELISEEVFMTIEKYRHPILFYGLSTAIPWAFWFTAAYVSHITPTNQFLATAVSFFGVVGLLGPTLIALWMIWPHADLRDDFKRRMIGLKGVKHIYLVLTCFLMLTSILLAQAISLLFGYSADQFNFSSKSSFSAGIFPGILGTVEFWGQNIELNYKMNRIKR